MGRAPSRAAYNPWVPEDLFWGIVYSLAPTILIGLLFWFIIRSIIKSDANERRAYAKVEAEELARIEAERR